MTYQPFEGADVALQAETGEVASFVLRFRTIPPSSLSPVIPAERALQIARSHLAGHGLQSLIMLEVVPQIATANSFWELGESSTVSLQGRPIWNCRFSGTRTLNINDRDSETRFQERCSFTHYSNIRPSCSSHMHTYFHR